MPVGLQPKKNTKKKNEAAMAMMAMNEWMNENVREGCNEREERRRRKKKKKKKKREVSPRFELGLLDSESRVLTVTPRNRLGVVDEARQAL